MTYLLDDLWGHPVRRTYDGLGEGLLYYLAVLVEILLNLFGSSEI